MTLNRQTQQPYNPITADVIDRISTAVGRKALVFDPEKLKEFSKDATEQQHVPELVVEVESTGQVQAIMRLATEYRFPVTPRGMGTGLAGGAVPVFGGVVLSMAKMNRIISIDRENLIAVTEPGVVTLDLKNAALEKGLFYPPDPASLDKCSIGGNVSTNAGGPACVKYGTTRDYVLGLEAVLASGNRIRAGVQTRKGVVGYDLVRLLAGSEGTLGIITQLILKLIPNPPAITTMVALFPRLSAAMEAVSSVLASGYTPCAIEFLDRHCIELVGDLIPFEGVLNAGAFLLMEMDGIPSVIEREIKEAGQICLDCGAVDARLAPDSQKRSQMWEVRKQVSLRIEESAPVYIPEDVVLPIARIAKFVEALPAIEEKYGMKIFSFGHAGDGNIHLNITAESNADPQKLHEGTRTALERVLSMGGTISGEHGIGTAKMQFLPMELSDESIRIQKEIKRIFDPNMILNPGKIFQF